MKQFECYPGYHEFVVRDNKNEVEFSIGDPTEIIYETENEEPTRDEILYNISDLSESTVNDMYEDFSLGEGDNYAVTDFNDQSVDFDFTNYTETERDAMKNAIKEGLMQSYLPTKENTSDKRFECIPGYHEYLIVDNEKQIEISIGDPNELFDSLDGHIADGIDNYAEVVEDIAERAGYENIDDLVVAFGSGDSNSFDFNEYTDEDKAEMKAVIKERLSADFLPAKKKSLSQVKKTVAEKKGTSEYKEAKSKDNGR